MARWVLCLLLLLPAACPARDLQDFAALAGEWLTCRYQGYTPQADYDRSGCVDLIDLAILAEEWLMATDLIINGQFNDDTGWDLGGGQWVIADGVATFTQPDSVGGNPIIAFPLSGTLSANLVIGKVYRLRFTISQMTGVHKLYVSFSLGEGTPVRVGEFGNGSHTVLLPINYAANKVFFNPNGLWGDGDQAVVDDVSLVDLTVGENLVAHGTFDDAAAWTAEGWVIEDQQQPPFAYWDESMEPSGTALSQAVAVTPGKTYISVVSVNVYGGPLAIRLGGRTVAVLSDTNDAEVVMIVKGIAGDAGDGLLKLIAAGNGEDALHLVYLISLFEAAEPLSDSSAGLLSVRTALGNARTMCGDGRTLQN